MNLKRIVKILLEKCLLLGTQRSWGLEGRIGSRLLATVSKALGPFHCWFHCAWVLWDPAFAGLHRFWPYLNWEHLKFNRVDSITEYYWTLRGGCWGIKQDWFESSEMSTLFLYRASFLLNKSTFLTSRNIRILFY